MRILMLDNELPPLGGGMGTANMALLKQFSQVSEVEIDEITSALGRKNEFESFSKKIKIYKVPVWNRNIHHSSNLELILYTIQALSHSIKLHRRRKYDLCFAWSALPAGAVALALFKLYRLPFMVWVSGPDIPGFERRYKPLYPILVPLIKSIWRNATPLIAKCSEEVDMIRTTSKSQPVDIIPNGVDISHFYPASHQNHNGGLKIICVARVIERKGQHHLIQAVKRIVDKGFKILVEFIGTGDFLPDCQDLAAKLGVENHVRFRGYISREELPRYYANSHIFVLPSFNEGMSLAALEALAAGLPLILTRTGGSYDLVEEGTNGYLYDWGDIDNLEKCIYQFIQQPALIDRMGKASRSHAVAFSWPVIGDRYMQLFKTSFEKISA